MTNAIIRDAVQADFPDICALNDEAVQHTGPMDADRLAVLHGLSCHHRVACVDGRVAGFLLAMGSSAAYENANFEWFARSLRQFVYIDRVVVSPSFRGLRLGTLLYEDLFRHARESAVPFVTCEYNIVPPNEPSRLFHDRHGFREQGTQWVADGTKLVSLQAAAT